MTKPFSDVKVLLGVISLIVCGLAITFGMVAYGEQPSLEGSYEVRPLLEESQNQKGIDYFSLVVQPEETREVSITIINHALTSENFRVQLNRSYTNSNGFIDYSQNIAGKMPCLAANISQLTNKRQQLVMVEAQSSKQVTFQLKLPKESFEGVLLGGIYVTKIENEDSKKALTKDAGVYLKQQLDYGIAVMLQEKVPYQGIEKVVLHNLNLGAVNYQSVLIFELENSQPNLMKDVSMTTTIYKEGAKKSYANLTKESMSFAPNSSFSLNIPWEQQEIQAGNYRAKTVVTSANNQWEFSNRFSVTDKQISKIHKEGDPIKKGTSFSLLTGLIWGVTILIFLGCLGWKVRSHKFK